jgi:hypothetical protein
VGVDAGETEVDLPCGVHAEGAGDQAVHGRVRRRRPVRDLLQQRVKFGPVHAHY